MQTRFDHTLSILDISYKKRCENKPENMNFKKYSGRLQTGYVHVTIFSDKFSRDSSTCTLN